uniref:Toc35 n=1 Tax=Arundo donax TaxID=35708 RepID=A0A0A9CKE6_ARUDO
MDTLDEQVIRAITNSFGKDIWRRALVVLTHAQLSPPDGIDYNDFFTRRSEALLRYICSGAGIYKREYGVMHVFICYVTISIMLYGLSVHKKNPAICIEFPQPRLDIVSHFVFGHTPWKCLLDF